MHIPSPRRGFTLVEILVVIIIIGILMALLLPSIAYIQGNARVTQTQQLVAQIEAPISVYHTNTGRYPLEGVTLPDGDFEPGNNAVVSVALTAILAAIDEDSFGPGGPNVIKNDDDDLLVVDIWETPVYYQPWDVYATLTDAGGDPLEPINPTSYQLWSFGPDLQNSINSWDGAPNHDVALPPEDEELILPHGDDITCWE